MLGGLRQTVRRRALEALGGPRLLRVFAIPGVSTAVARALVLRARIDAAIARGVERIKKRFESER